MFIRKAKKVYSAPAVAMQSMSPESVILGTSHAVSMCVEVDDLYNMNDFVEDGAEDFDYEF